MDPVHMFWEIGSLLALLCGGGFWLMTKQAQTTNRQAKVDKQFDLIELRLKQFEGENIERKEETRNIMDQLLDMGKTMTRIEITMNNKVNRP